MFQGLDSFAWFTGVVEDRFDPMMLGRVRVRVVGSHTAQKVQDEFSGIPTEELPWMTPIMPITSASMNGIGQSPLGMVEGTHVVGFWKDPKGMQDGLIMGTYGGIPQEAPGEGGFNDPQKVFPKTELTDSEYILYPGFAEEYQKAPSDFILEPDTNRLSRGPTDFKWKDVDGTIKPTKHAETISEYANLSRDINVAMAMDIGYWSQPESGWAKGGKYPYNKVEESESGHIFEIDDTRGGERLHWWHRRGTFTEIHEDGSKVVKVANDDYEIILGDKYVHIKGTNSEAENFTEPRGGNISVTIDGSCNMRVERDFNLDVNGSMTWNIGGNFTTTIAGFSTHMILGTFTQISVLPNITIAPQIHLNP